MKRIQGHRGCLDKYPQNTLAPFEGVILAKRATGNCPWCSMGNPKQQTAGGGK